ncbi:unnamed protein product [Linum tenue]|uniref:Lipoamide acyltransferase component of branched-chain alpha-keto acid dehydrogenase complex, mitochondrial n=1 Tax=Linum tenue TaxID=586396 RepID=A0AAV0HU18_9ROSI|nr:unnamed protein product [Linum tenue]
MVVVLCWRWKRPCFSGSGAADLPEDRTVDVPLAQTGEGIAESELLQWFVNEVQPLCEVDEFEPLCQVQCDKAVIKITGHYRGRVSRMLYVPGDIVKVGETLLKMVVDESQVPVQSVDSEVQIQVNGNLEGELSSGADLNTTGEASC